MFQKLILFALAAFVATEVYLDERFEDGENYKNRWVQSEHKSDYGVFKLTSGKFYGDKEADKGIQTTQDAKFYEFSRKLDKPFSNEKKTLVLQYTVKHEQKIDCGGGYIKLMSADTDLKAFNGDTPYNIMFGPDICGYSTKKVHFIISYKGKNYQNKEEITCKDDEYTHLYTLILNPDNTYKVLIDNAEVKSGDLVKDYEILPPKTILDPEDKKPSDWVDAEYIDDVEDKKPDDWDKPEHIADVSAKKPDDWDDEMDGEWEAPKIANPEFKGEWKAKQIKNPAYKGEWKQKEIPNPEYIDDPHLYRFENVGAVGFDLWQVKSNTIFDNILVTDDVDFAKKHGEMTYGKTHEPEKEMAEKILSIERKKEEEKEAAKKDEPEEEADEADEAGKEKDEL